jgi:hypothetical protein
MHRCGTSPSPAICKGGRLNLNTCNTDALKNYKHTSLEVSITSTRLPRSSASTLPKRNCQKVRQEAQLSNLYRAQSRSRVVLPTPGGPKSSTDLEPAGGRPCGNGMKKNKIDVLGAARNMQARARTVPRQQAWRQD